MNLHTALHQAFKTTFQITQAIAPGIAQRWAARLFIRPMRFERPARETALIQNAVSERRPFRSYYQRASDAPYYVCYQWGNASAPAVLLIHGWAGRGSQMATLAAPLVTAGYQVITFDAPAHGDSWGRCTNLLEVSNIIHALSEEFGGFAAMIGHSFGGMAAGFALAEGAQTSKLVTIGSPAEMMAVFDGFRRQLNASNHSIDGVKQYIERVAQRPVEHFSLTHTLAGRNIGGLIVHDKEDNEVPCEQAARLHHVWPDSELHYTSGLGHRRILRDDATIARVVDFVRGDSVQRMAPVAMRQPA